MTARLPDLDDLSEEARALDWLYEKARALRNLPVFQRIDEVTILITSSRMNGWTNIDEEKIFAAAGLTARGYWQRAFGGRQCTPEKFANLLSLFMDDPADLGITGDVLPVVPGNEPAWFSWARKPGHRRPLYRRRSKRTRSVRQRPGLVFNRTMGTVERELRSVLRREYQIRAPFFVETRDLGATAPPIDAKTAEFVRRHPTVGRVHVGEPPLQHVPSRTEIFWERAAVWLIDNFPELVPPSLRHALIEDREPPAVAEEPLAPGSIVGDPLAATTEPPLNVKPQVDSNDAAYIAHRDDFIRENSRYPSRAEDFDWGQKRTPKVGRLHISQLRGHYIPDHVRSGGRTKNLSNKPVEK